MEKIITNYKRRTCEIYAKLFKMCKPFLYLITMELTTVLYCTEDNVTMTPRL